MSLHSSLQEKLCKREKESNLRQLKSLDPSKVDFLSNDYLGLARSEKLSENIVKSYLEVSQKFAPIRNGSTGSRLLSGENDFFNDIEQELAQFFDAEEALFLGSGYHANVALLSSISTRHDVILYDQLSHASLKEGCRLSASKSFSFRHNDLEDLEIKLQKFTSLNTNILIVVESVYSMDGDIAPLQKLTALSEKYKAHLIVDEAHSTGLFGKNGNGLVCELGLEKEVFARIHTFGKAFGIQGAVIVSEKLLIDYLINFAVPLIYTTAPPLWQWVSVQEVLSLMKKHQNDLKEQLSKNIEYFQKLFDTSYPTPIQRVLIAGNEACQQAALALQERGFEVRAIKSPTVPKGAERLRICLHAYNTKEQIERLYEEVKRITVLC